MILHGNVLGMLLIAASGAVAAVGYLLLKLPDPVTMMAVGLTLITADLVIRFRTRSESGWLMSKELGGYLFFIPAWIFGIVIIIANILSGLLPS